MFDKAINVVVCIKTRPRVHKALQNQDQVKKSFPMDFYSKPTIIIKLLTVGIL